MIQNSEYNEEGLACLCSTISVEPIPYKRMLRHRSALKKKQFVVHHSKKNADCADITKIKDEKIQMF